MSPMSLDADGRPPEWATIDGNEAVARVAHRLSEVVAIYPITPASPMGELADEWSAAGRPNLWGTVPSVVEMQSEGGAAGAVHGALQAGALTTTFTASQGLLLMLPNLYKIAGELNAFCMHVAARSLATHALSIFCDHSDVMAARGTGMALLCSGSVQEAQDMAAIGHAATLRSRVPFLHFFDGFRTSHEVAKIRLLDDGVLHALLGQDGIEAHRDRALSPEHPVVRGTAQNPDVFFQAREAANPFYDACPGFVHEVMERFGELTGRHYRPFDYVGHPAAERVVVMMGSGTETAHETVEWLVARGEKVGLVKVRLYRPFDTEAFTRSLPPTVQRVAVLDRTKEPGAPGEPLYLDVAAALRGRPDRPGTGRERVTAVGGRYGLGSKEFAPGMVRGVLDALASDAPPHDFTVGIADDVTHRSLAYDAALDVEPEDTVRAVFYGLGSDGTVGANKQAIKIIGERTDHHAQGYFVYDSKKAGAVTVSHLRFGPRPIRSAYQIGRASYVACHAPHLLESLDVLERAAPGATFLVQSPHPPDRVWDALPREVQEGIVERDLQLYAIDAHALAREVGLGRRISAIMQTCFFALSGVLPRDEAIEAVRREVEKAYGQRGPEVVRRNWAAIDATLDRLHGVPIPGRAPAGAPRPPAVPADAPDFVQRITSVMLAGKGDLLPVSAFPVDGTWPTGTSQYEKRHLALEIPEWDPEICIQCNKCVEICPHAVIRPKVVPPAALEGAPEGMKHTPWRGKEVQAPNGGDLAYVLQVAPDDCTGCGLCVAFCPAKDRRNPRHKAIDMVPVEPIRERERAGWSFFQQLPRVDRSKVHLDVKGAQLLEPLFEFSGACAGCGETPYLKLLTQLFGDRALVANATGCSSIYGGNLPTTPWSADDAGRGPAWSNSLFEDNAEFGLGFRLAVDVREGRARALVRGLAGQLGDALVSGLLDAPQVEPADIEAQRERVAALRDALRGLDDPAATQLDRLADALVKRSVWIVGGDGWAYDIGFGGLDHVLASGADVNVLVLDTEVYSNTGGQQSKATPLGAAAKFAATGKATGKKDLGLLAMTYGHVYVAQVAMGARDAQTLRAFREAERWRGPSLIIAYSPCIAHGYDLVHGADQQRLAVESGMWPLYRFDPQRIEAGEAPLEIDSPAPRRSVREYMANEGRFRMVQLRDPARHGALVRAAEEHAARRRALYQQLALIHLPEDLLHGTEATS
ncbi:MAG: pyruvate:ferredoxin (flavodoxin) oxidoreductase [Myxococcota bacterium]